jgi:nitrogen fixation NifU-like protein
LKVSTAVFCISNAETDFPPKMIVLMKRSGHNVPRRKNFKELKMSQMYNEIVMDHFQNPRNMGRIENADMLIQVGDPGCGDSVLIFMQIEEDVLTDIKYKIYGCGAAIATSSMGSVLAKGKTLDELLAFQPEDISTALGGLPEEKEHCSNLIASALHAGVAEYRKNRSDPSKQPLAERKELLSEESLAPKN